MVVNGLRAQEWVRTSHSSTSHRKATQEGIRGHLHNGHFLGGEVSLRGSAKES